MGMHSLSNILMWTAHKTSLTMVLSLRVMTWHRVNFLSTVLYKEVDLAAMNLQIAWRQKPHSILYPAPETKYRRCRAIHDWKFYYYFLVNSPPPLLQWRPQNGQEKRFSVLIFTLHIYLQSFRSGKCGPVIQNTLKKICSYLPHNWKKQR